MSRLLLGTKAADFVDAMRGRPIERIAKVAADFHQKGFRLELHVAHDQMKGRDLPGAIAAVKKVLANSTGYLDVQFDATMQLGEVEMLELMRSDKPQTLTADRKLATAEALCKLARRKPKHLHLFAQTTRKAAQLGVAIHKVLGLLMSWKGHLRKGDDPLWLAVVTFELNDGLLDANRKYRQSLRLAEATAKSKYRWIVSRPLVDIALAITTLAGLLETVPFPDAAKEYRASAFQLFKFAAAIATENRNMDELFNAVLYSRMLETKKDGPVIQWIRSVVDGWREDTEYRRNAEEPIQRWIQRQDGRTFDDDIQTNFRQIHQNILTSAGIDPTTEPWVSRIDLAIKDHDPTRVLKACRQKRISDHPLGDPMLPRLGLERANPKIISCALHGHALGGPDLDGINAQFNERYCNTCPDRAPRADDWQFYSEPEK